MTLIYDIYNVYIIYDVLCEISIISEALQKRDATIVKADKWIRRTILYLENLKDLQKGKKQLEVASGIDKMELFSMMTNNPKIGVIHRNQFLKSFINNMKYRLSVSTNGTEENQGVSTSFILNELRVLEPSEWPHVINLQYGEDEIQSLSKRFKIAFPKCINVYRDYIANGGRFIPADLNEIISYHRIIACSSAECERGFTSLK